VGNIGPVANADGQIDIQIRDLDQTIIDNPAHDLIRLALSLATAARGSDLPGVTIATMHEEKTVGYQRALVRGARFLAGGVGAAHTRQLYTAVCTEWRRALSRSRSKRLSAPSRL